MASTQQVDNGNGLSKPISMSSIDGPITSPPMTSPVEEKRTLSPGTTPLSPIKHRTDESLADEVPLAAQLPISTFASLPEFPPEASHLRALTLTADIPLPEYQSLVSGGEYNLPKLPQSITHLTFELFSLGFPGRNPRYLSNLSAALPNLKSLTAFACLLDGLDDASRKDAERFFDTARGLRELHLIDTFVRPGYWTAIGKLLDKRAEEELEIQAATENDNGGATVPTGSTQVIEVSYTYRGHSDSDFLARLHGEELPRLIVPGLIGAGFGFVEEAEGDKALEEDAEDGKEKNADSLAGGILPFATDSRATSALKKRFASFKAGELRSVKVLNLGMWTLKVDDLDSILRAIQPPEGKEATGLIDLTVSLLMTKDYLPALAKILSASPATKRLESLEIIGVPSVSKASGTASGPTKVDQQLDNIMDKGDEAWGGEDVKLLKLEDVAEAFAGSGLSRLEMSVLRAAKVGTTKFERQDGSGGRWSGGAAGAA